MKSHNTDLQARRSGRRIRNLGLMFAVASMIAGFTVGLFRLLKDNNTLYVSTLLPWYHLHSIFLIFGFLGGLLMTERIAGSIGMKGVASQGFNVVMLLFSIAGVLLLPAGWVYHIEALRIFGAILLAASALLFTILLIRLGQVAGDYSSFGIMAAGTVSLAISGILIAFELPNDNLPLIMQMLLFPILFILGERIELTRFTHVSHRKAVTASVFTLSWIAISTTGISPILYAIGWNSYTAVLSMSTIILLTLAVITLLMERKRRALSATTKLQKYTDVGIRTAYFWLFTGIILFLLRINGIGGLYDASIHAIALGFVATFIVAHGPVIFPVLLGKKGDMSKLTLLPLNLLTLSNALRIFGDISKIFSANSSAAISISYAAVSLSGILLAFDAVAFAIMMKRIMSGGAGKGSATVTSRNIEG
jgi:hypothetical protein